MALWLLALLGLCARPGTALPPRHMDSVVQLLEALEATPQPLSVPALGRALGACSTPGCRAVLGDPPEVPARPRGLSDAQWQLLRQLLGHDPSAPQLGAVLAPDGSSLTLGPLLAGIEVGLKRASGWRHPSLEPALDPLFAVTIAEALGTAFLRARGGNGSALGPDDGCWDDVAEPRNYTLQGPPAALPLAVANGAMDGVLLGARLAQGARPLAQLLREYYGTGDGSGTGSGDGSGSGSGDGTGSGSGEGTGSGRGSGSGNGTGSGSGDGTGKGSGRGSGNGSGDGSGDGTGKGSGDGSGNGTGSGTGKGTESGSGDGSGKGRGSGSGDGTGSGSGDGTGKGSGSGSGNGNGDGTGSGTGSGTGDGSGKGSGSGSGDGRGNGSGNGTGDGSGKGTGSGSGDGSGDGSGNGTGDGRGSGSGDGSGDGTGSGSGDGSGSGTGSSTGSGTGKGSGDGTGRGSGDGSGSGSGSGTGSGTGDGSGKSTGSSTRSGTGTGTGSGSGSGERGRPPSSRRRRAFAALAAGGKLRREVEAVLGALRAMPGAQGHLRHVGQEELAAVARRAAQEFLERFVECPAVIPRCAWGARPYRGTPSLLAPPLASVYIHHTFSPASPCATFAACARAMRSMQSFHQDVRGWDDIGYSFVVGSDGYLYEGRGWHWVGAHTKGHNREGFGLAFVGDFSSAVPAADALSLVRDSFLPCAVRGGHLRAAYSLRGHRQLRPTLCPGTALFREIQTWHGFQQ